MMMMVTEAFVQKDYMISTHSHNIEGISRHGSKSVSHGQKSSRNYPIEVKLSSKQVLLFVVMGQTPFYLTSNELEHHFLNIERTRTCASIGDQTLTL